MSGRHFLRIFVKGVRSLKCPVGREVDKSSQIVPNSAVLQTVRLLLDVMSSNIVL